MNRQAKKWKSSGSQSWEWFGGEKKSYTWFKRKMHASFFCGEEEGKEGRRREENQAWVKAGVSLFRSEGTRGCTSVWVTRERAEVCGRGTSTLCLMSLGVWVFYRGNLILAYLCHFQKGEGIRFKQKCPRLGEETHKGRLRKKQVRNEPWSPEKGSGEGKTWCWHPPSSSHPFGSFKRMPFAQRCALFKAGNRWFPEIRFRLRSSPADTGCIIRERLSHSTDSTHPSNKRHRRWWVFSWNPWSKAEGG